MENIVRKGEIACNKQFLLYSQCFLPYMVLIILPQTKLGGYTGVTLSVRPRVAKSCPGHNFKSIKASNFKLHTQIGHNVEKCSEQEP